MGIIVGQKIVWTEHSLIKMRQYQLSASRVKRVLRFPKRLEEGIAPKTVAGMQPAGSKKHPYEIWVMWALGDARAKSLAGARDKANKTRFSLNRKTTIISAWKYPGISPIHEPPPIPEDVWEIIRKEQKG